MKAALVAMSIHAVDSIERSSELQGLFDEDGRNEDWHAMLADLRTRLAAFFPSP